MNRLWIAVERPGRPPAPHATMRRPRLAVRLWSLLVALPLVLGACAGAPSGTPACTAASVSEVLTALEHVPGYTFTASGTSLSARPVPPGGSVTYEYEPREIELRGAYRAPDRSRLDVVAGGDGAPPLSAPGIFFLGADAIVVIGDRTWLVSQGSSQVTASDPGRSNLVLEVLRGKAGAGEVQWSSTGACSFHGEQRRDVNLDAMSLSVQIEVGPGALPRKIVEEWRFDQANAPRQEYKLSYVLDFGQAPDIVAPEI